MIGDKFFLHICIIIQIITSSNADIKVDLSLASLFRSCYVNILSIGSQLRFTEDFSQILRSIHHSGSPLVNGDKNLQIFLKSSSPSRFISCSVQIYSFDESIISRKNITQLQTLYINAVQESKLTRFNPKYIILTMIQQVRCNMYHKILDLMHRASISFSSTSKIFALCFRNGKVTTISIPCLHCDENDNIHLPFKMEINNPENIDHIWGRIHGNLLGKRVSTHFPFFEKSSEPLYLDPQICKLGLQGVHLNPTICALKIMAEFLNFTMGPGVKGSTVNIIADIYANVFFSTISSQDLLNPEKDGRVYSWANTAEFISFSFLVMIDHQLWNLKAYSRPIDTHSWFYFLIGLLLSSSVYYFIAHIGSKSSWFNFNNLLKTFWMFIAIIFEQSQNKLRSVSSKCFSNSRVVLLGAYIFSISFLCCIYKGCIVSYLILSPIPENIPKSIVEVAKTTEYFLITHEALYQASGSKLSTLKATILNELIDNIHHPGYYVELTSKLIFVDARNPSLSTCIINGALCLSDIVIDGNFTSIPLPKSNLIIVGSTTQLKRLKTIIEMETQAYLHFSSEIDMFNSRIPWFIYRNIFEPVISSAIARLQQSGVYGKWAEGYERQVTDEELLEFHYSHLFQNNSSKYIILEPKDFPKIFNRNKHKTQNMNTLTAKAFIVVAALFFLGICVSIGLFIIELFYKAVCCISKWHRKKNLKKREIRHWKKFNYIQ